MYAIKACKDLYRFFFIIKFIYYFQTFTVENNVYKGEIKSTYNYKSIGEIIWDKIKSHGDKIVHVSQYLHMISILNVL